MAVMAAPSMQLISNGLSRILLGDVSKKSFEVEEPGIGHPRVHVVDPGPGYSESAHSFLLCVKPSAKNASTTRSAA